MKNKKAIPPSSKSILGDINSSTEAFKPLLSPEQIAQLKQGSKIVLAILAVGGALTVAAAAPNIFKAFELAGIFNKPGGKLSFKKQQKKIAETFYYLKENGHIEFEDDPRGSLWAKLTSKGQETIKEMEITMVTVKKPAKWQRTWWLVAADIPTHEYRAGADLLRGKLKDMDFYPLQRTLWIYPYDPRKELEFITNYFGIGQFVTLMEICRLDIKDEERLKHHFNL